jgi:hypothetical protein
MTCKSLARFRVTSVFEIVVTYGEFGVRLFDVRIVDDADVAATENGAFVGVAGDRELSQVEVELLPQVHREDEGTHALVSCPVLLRGVPCERRVASDHLAVLGLQHSDGVPDVVAALVELSNRKGIFACSVEK